MFHVRLLPLRGVKEGLRPSTINVPSLRSDNLQAPTIFSASEIDGTCLGAGKNFADDKLMDRIAINYMDDSTISSAELHDPSWDPAVHDITAFSTNPWNKLAYPPSDHDTSKFNTSLQDVNQSMDHVSDMNAFSWPHNAEQRLNCPDYIPEHDVAAYSIWPHNGEQSMNYPACIPEHDITMFSIWPERYPFHDQMDGGPRNIILDSHQQLALFH